MTSPTDANPTKRPRLGNGPIVDRSEEGKIAATGSVPELDGIKQSNNQLAYLQAQLAATEALYSAYEAELDALAKDLGDIKRSHLQSGQPLWKDPQTAAVILQRRGQLTAPGTGRDDDVDTFSDLEEEVLLLGDIGSGHASQPGPQQAQKQEGGQKSHQQEPAAGPSMAVLTGSVAQADNQEQQLVDGILGSSAPGQQPGTSPAPADVQAAGAGASGGVKIDTDGAMGAAARSRLEALEATCSAVAQEDMEAQGAVACLAGRTGKYYLRGIVVTLGRASDTKGDVDVDLTLEEPPAARRAAPTTAEGVAMGEGQAAGPGASAGAASGVSGHRISRRQAMIRLGPDGQFRLVNMGRQPVLVNDVTVEQHQTVTLPHLSLVEVGGVKLLFLANMAAVGRVVRRSAALVL